MHQSVLDRLVSFREDIDGRFLNAGFRFDESYLRFNTSIGEFNMEGFGEMFSLCATCYVIDVVHIVLEIIASKLSRFISRLVRWNDSPLVTDCGTESEATQSESRRQGGALYVPWLIIWTQRLVRYRSQVELRRSDSVTKLSEADN